MGLADTSSSAQHTEKEVTNTAFFIKKEMSIETFSASQGWLKYIYAGERRDDAFDSVLLRDKGEYFVEDFASGVSLEN